MSDPVGRNEFEARMGDVKSDLTACGNAMRTQMHDLKIETREDFKSVWKAIDGMLVKTGILVTICCSIVMAIFKMIESQG